MKKTILLGISFLYCISSWAQTTATGYVYEDSNQNNKRDRKEQGVAGVSVSNGIQVVKTDADGRYTLPVGEDNILFVVKPSGYAVPTNEFHLPQFYYIHKPAGSPANLRYEGVSPTGHLPKEINFALHKQTEPANFRALVFGDPQVYSQQDLDWFKKGILSEVNGIQGIPFGISLGDLVGDNLHLFDNYKKAMTSIGIPWYNMVGNHDLNWDVASDSLADETFEAHFGPSTYAFEYGNAHFIVLDDILSPDPRDNSGYWGGLRDDQLAFVKNDLAQTDTSKLIVLAYHIPMLDNNDREFRSGDRTKIFSYLKNHKHVVMLCGHTHLQRQNFYGKEHGWLQEKPVHEYNAGTTSGDWYSGELNADNVPFATMRDGTEKGYAFLNVNGNSYSIDYKVAGKPADYQMSVYAPQVVAHRKDNHSDFYVNFFMGSKETKLQYRIGQGEWIPMDQTEGVDPTYAEMVNKWDRMEELVPGRKPSMPYKVTHLWRGRISGELPVGEHTIEVQATDLFGRTFFAKKTVNVKEPAPLPFVK